MCEKKNAPAIQQPMGLAGKLVPAHIHTGFASRAKPGELRVVAVLWNHNGQWILLRILDDQSAKQDG